uniref:Uncharacterized protein n=1 Tax=Anguilla anguilla TaxID=7936 RepID=A0A0E9RJ92_ANGAN
MIDRQIIIYVQGAVLFVVASNKQSSVFPSIMCIILAYFQTDFVLKVVNPFPLDI